MLLFVVIIFISLIAAVIYCNLLLYVVVINSELKFQHITTYSNGNRLVRSIVFSKKNSKLLLLFLTVKKMTLRAKKMTFGTHDDLTLYP